MLASVTGRFARPLHIFSAVFIGLCVAPSGLGAHEPFRDFRPDLTSHWDAREAPRREPGAGRHRVAPGQTLYRIAKSYDITVESLMAANGIGDPHFIRAGQRLLIPDPGHSPRVREAARTPPYRHGTPPREDWKPAGPALSPAFTRLLPATDAVDDPVHARALRALGRRMVEPPEAGRAFDSEVPAGYTFFGQFIDHDLTLVVGGKIGNERDSGPFRNLRTPALDLDSLYGEGPRLSPHLYDLPYLRAGQVIYRSRDSIRRGLPRVRSGHRGDDAALIGDPRNDENFILAQLHAAFIAFHNSLVDRLVDYRVGPEYDRYCDGGCSPRALADHLPQKAKEAIFEDAHKHVIHYYHRLILEDYLPRLIGPARTRGIYRNGPDLFDPAGSRAHERSAATSAIPIEFAAAAFRYGHSQVRESYVIRRGRHIDLASDLARRSMGAHTKDLLVDWRYFFDIAPEPPEGFNHARRIDPLVVTALHELPEFAGAPDSELASLPVRNLLRGQQFRLPSGQAAAEIVLAHLHARGVYRRQAYDGPLPPGSDRLLRATLGEAETPLWYYILQEAAVLGGPTGYGYRARFGPISSRGDSRFRPAAYGDDDGYGHTLGPVGGTIVGEVLIGLIAHYEATTGEGLAYRPVIGASAHPRPGSLSLSHVVSEDGEQGPRFLMRDLMIEAGVASPVRR